MFCNFGGPCGSQRQEMCVCVLNLCVKIYTFRQSEEVWQVWVCVKYSALVIVLDSGNMRFHIWPQNSLGTLQLFQDE